MPLVKDPSGRRSVTIDVEIPGTPEEVWDAIATGPGVSSWFMPTTVETGEDGVPSRVVTNFGPGMDSIAEVTAWEPPHRFTAQSQIAPDAPPMATEWSVQAESGGVCVVRVVHSLFANDDDWDDQLVGTETGWPKFFRILRIYMTHFAGQACVNVPLSAVIPGELESVWASLLTDLGLEGAKVGQQRGTTIEAPALSGEVEWAAEGGEPLVLLRLQEPGAGVAHLQAVNMGEQVYLAMHLYLYGEDSQASADRIRSPWQDWFDARSG